MNEDPLDFLKNEVHDNYEEVLHETGYGWFSFKVLLVSCLSMLSVGVQSCIASFVLPAAKCQLHITTYQMGLIMMAYMTGGVISTFLWGIMADVHGRRNTLLAAHLLSSVVTLLESLSPNVEVMMLTRALNGFLIGGPSNVVFIYLTEFIGKKRRGVFLNIVGLSFVLAWIILPVIGWLIIPYKLINLLGLQIGTWRIYIIIFSIPGFLTAMLMLSLPETPWFLAFNNREVDAMKVLKNMFQINCQISENKFPVKCIILEKKLPVITNKTGMDQFKFQLSNVSKQTKELFSRPYLKKSLLICFVVFSNMAAGFGLGLWVPELLKRTHTTSVNCIGIEKCIKIDHFNLSLELNKTNGYICNDDIDNEVFIEAIIAGVCCFIAGLACCVCTGLRLGNCVCAAGCCIGAGSLMASACGNSGTAGVIGAVILQAAANNGNVLLGRLILVVLPQRLNSLGVCMGMFAGRFGGVVTSFMVGALLEIQCHLPFIVISVLCAGSIVGIIFLKKISRDSMKDENYKTKQKELTQDDESNKIRNISLDFINHI